MDFWEKKMSENYSITFNKFGKQPINSLSSFIMIFYIYNSIKNNKLQSHKNNNIQQNYLFIFIIINLLFSTFAHFTFNKQFIFLDGFTMTLPLLYLTYKYKLYFLFIILLIFNRNSFLFAIALLYIVYFKYNSIIDYKLFKYSLIFIFIATFFWFLDIHYKQFWFLFPHALWHIFMSIGLNKLIKSIYW